MPNTFGSHFFSDGVLLFEWFLGGLCCLLLWISMCVCVCLSLIVWIWGSFNNEGVFIGFLLGKVYDLAQLLILLLAGVLKRQELLWRARLRNHSAWTFRLLFFHTLVDFNMDLLFSLIVTKFQLPIMLTPVLVSLVNELWLPFS